ncbi:MAG: transcription elongation factor GreA [Candidatus Dormibacteraeota bacterium]|nr:transcription elongation factor GreA [Candidatus Dormibacteraeota bacterium]
MMEGKPVLLTVEGLRQLEAELKHLVTVRRVEVADRIRQARDFGEIAENAEYIEAKNEQGLVEGRIQTLEGLLQSAVLIEEAPRETGVVTVGTQVEVLSAEGSETYSIVGAAEADPLGGRISNESPLGRALLGRRAGDEVTWSSPGGISSGKILRVS